MKREKKFADLDGRSEKSLPLVSGTMITRYAPGFVLQFHVGEGEVEGLLRRFNGEYGRTELPGPVVRRRSEETRLRPARAQGASYSAGDVVVCINPDGSVAEPLQLAVFLSDVDGIDPASPKVGQISDRSALADLVEEVERQPVAGELLSVPVTAELDFE